MDKRVQEIRLKGVRQNNLKDFDLNLPLGQLIVVTGLSGTGKSSLVFDTLYAEGQRRYVETFSPYTRQFLEMMDRPEVDSIENVPPSIAIEQTNTVRNSRSTVGTMTELCDYFKVWFAQVAALFDPETGERIEDDNPQTIWQKAHRLWKEQTVMVGFLIVQPENIKWEEILSSLQAQGYTRGIVKGEVSRLEEMNPKGEKLWVLQDRLVLKNSERARFIEAAKTALHFGKGRVRIFDEKGKDLADFSEGLHNPVTGKTFNPARPALFSFNSPIGACPDCRGFGRVIEIDYQLVIPDETLTLKEGALKPFVTGVYRKHQKLLEKAAKANGVRLDVPWCDLSEEEKTFVLKGDPARKGRRTGYWLGVDGFFEWVQSKIYKMHMRVFLSRYRSYVTCPSCEGKRLQQEALNWKWENYTLPDLYALPVKELLALLRKKYSDSDDKQVRLAMEAIFTRLRYLEQVGLGYLSLDRSSRTLSGGETQRVNLTTCLGTGLVDTLFVLDEPSIGLHARDIDRLIGILKRLTALGNTVVVVEHDESVMRAADHLIELGPKPGAEGGQIVFEGSLPEMKRAKTLTGSYLSGAQKIELPEKRREVPLGEKAISACPFLYFENASKNNIKDLSFSIPLQRFVGISGVSGSGKSTLLDSVIHQGLLHYLGRVTEDAASIGAVESAMDIVDVVRVDQSTVTKTPRSCPVLFVNVWDRVRELFARTDEAKTSGMTASSFSFNSGQGRCEHCQGLGYERVEMQFLSDVFVKCPVCDGKRFKPEVLSIRWRGKSVDEVLDMDVQEAIPFFKGESRVQYKLNALDQVGLGYLKLGQPLNTLSGGESQRLKLMKYLTDFDQSAGHSIILLDEPTTGLHRDDVGRLIAVLQRLVDHGQTVIVIEHQMDVLAAADWIIEMGPEAGSDGGQIVCSGAPEAILKKKTVTGAFLAPLLGTPKSKVVAFPEAGLMAAEPEVAFIDERPQGLTIAGAREHNLKNLELTIPHKQMTVLTGVSGSGKSTLAFDIIFAEGQRRFMESMSAYARQFVEQMPKAEVDRVAGIAPTVAIEQRTTHGTSKSTVATITEVAQYLRLLYARLGVQHNPKTGNPVGRQTEAALMAELEKVLRNWRKKEALYLIAPVVRGRKGHHQPLADWAKDHGYEWMICDGKWVRVEKFKKLGRYREHDIELVVGVLKEEGKIVAKEKRQELLDAALVLGKGSVCVGAEGKPFEKWLSLHQTDPETGEAFADLEPKHFSWNSTKGWCPECHGHGLLFRDDEPVENMACPECEGDRLNEISRSVRLYFKNDKTLSLPEMLRLTAKEILDWLSKVDLDTRGKAIMKEILPQIKERLSFMEEVGLGYLNFDRATKTLSGGEAQRIRLASQLGSNLSGALYVLDEPSIGLHSIDNERLIGSLQELKKQGNTLLVVEHDEDTIKAADWVIDLGPGAGIHGGELLAEGTFKKIIKEKRSLTGQCLKTQIKHPQRGAYRKLPKVKDEAEWLILKKAKLRNLKGFDLKIPLNRLSVVCGVSGAGKSTLVHDLIKPAVEKAIRGRKQSLEAKDFEALFDTDGLVAQSLSGVGAFAKVVEVDQSPIGKTPRSTPATYVGIFDKIRNFFATLPEAKIRGFKSGDFSFNTAGGRCENCKGAGRVKLEMAFLPNTYVTCEECGGSRYGAEITDIYWNEKSIADVLQMSFEEAAAFFSFHHTLSAVCALMVDTGLGYLTLGQSSPTLSGGEAQRLKLVSELAKGVTSVKEIKQGRKRKNLYLLEEPTIGLHLSDCSRLVEVLQQLVDQGHTVVVIEHHLDVLAEADYLIELGPQGGAAGGKLLYQGAPLGLKKVKNSPTGSYLKEKLSE